MKPGVDYIGVGVGALIFDSSGKVLLTLRGPQSKNERGKWEIPGGGVEFGETLDHAIVREVYEELGITIKVEKPLQVCDHIIPEEKQHWVSPTYICSIVSGKSSIRESEKCIQLGWFSLEEAQQLPLSIVTHQDIQLLLQQQKVNNEKRRVSYDR